MATNHIEGEGSPAKLAETARLALYRIVSLAKAIDDAGEPLQHGSEVMEPWRISHLDAVTRIVHYTEIIVAMAEQCADHCEQVEQLCLSMERATSGRTSLRAAEK